MKYLIEFTNHKASILIELNEDGLAKSLVLDHGTMPFEARKFLWEKFPYNLKRLEQYKILANVKVTEVLPDLSFDSFWKTYNYKVGKKMRAEKLWNALDELNRASALKHIYKYEKWLLEHPNTDKQYPETFLYNQPWNY
jgi:hypothetical protein